MLTSDQLQETPVMFQEQLRAAVDSQVNHTLSSPRAGVCSRQAITSVRVLHPVIGAAIPIVNGLLESTPVASPPCPPPVASQPDG